ncbi:MAG: sugar transferase [Deltaproteobacteria bacterium]|nr:sugar transferase [Deltaproteobacteria bacterium]
MRKVCSELISEYLLKRAFAFILAFWVFFISLPLWFIFAIAINFEDGGAVLYPQKRWGKYKKPISVYRFGPWSLMWIKNSNASRLIKMTLGLPE